MKRYAIYTGLLVIGIFLGWLFFGENNSDDKTITTETVEKEKRMWTCSMHPQIILPHPGDCPVCGMDLIPADANGENQVTAQFKMTKAARALANVETSKVSFKKGAGSLLLSGKITEDERTNSVQTAHFGGRIEKLYVNYTGEHLKKGQLLMSVYSPQIVTAQKELLEAAKTKSSQPKLYKGVRNKLKLWKLSEKQIDAIEASGKVENNLPVYADISGVVVKKMVEEGDHVMEGEALLKIANLKRVWVILDAYESDINYIDVGDKVVVHVNALPGKAFKTKISFIEPLLDTQTRTIAIRAELPNKENLFKPGMFATGEITITHGSKDKNEPLTIPKSAVLWTGKRSVVYLKTPGSESMFEMREVKLGAEMSHSYQLLSGLKEGDEIVTNGTFSVDAAAQLQGKKSMMNRKEKEHTRGASKTEEKIIPLNGNNNDKTKISKVLKAYSLMKDAFVASDMETVKKRAVDFAKKLQTVKNAKWREYSATIYTETQKIVKAASLEQQRQFFKTVSKDFIRLMQYFRKGQQKMYVQHCPMVPGGGGDWLSLEKEIRNPYFGDKMLKCGTVTNKIN